MPRYDTTQFIDLLREPSSVRVYSRADKKLVTNAEYLYPRQPRSLEVRCVESTI